MTEVNESIEKTPITETKTDTQTVGDTIECKEENEIEVNIQECSIISVAAEVRKLDSFISCESGEVNDEIRLLGDLDSLPVSDELVGATGSDSGVEGCGRALSSGGGSRSCASSVVSCGSGCGSESSSIAGAPPRPRRRVNVTVPESQKLKGSPIGSSTPRPVTAPRGPNLATRERARSREKPAIPEKPRPLTPKPRIRPTNDLPNVIRESPALRAKPTKTSTARCRTPVSPSEDKKWPTNGTRMSSSVDMNATRVAADKYGTLPRRRKEADPEGSPKHESTPPTSRRPTITRSVSSRSTTKSRVRIYAEKSSQTVLLGTDVESALGGIVPNIERVEISRSSRGVQASSRDNDLAKLSARVKRAEEAACEERERREAVEAQLAEERAARLAAHAEIERNSLRLLELAGAGADAGAEGCLKALDEQLRASAELAAQQRQEIERLRDQVNVAQIEAGMSRTRARALDARLTEVERDATEMQDFLAAETSALGDSLRDAEAELARSNHELERRRAECRQLVRMCEQRRQEVLSARAHARTGSGAAAALDALCRRLRTLTDTVARAYKLPKESLEPTVYHNDAFSRSDSGEALTPDDDNRGGLLAALTRALKSAPAVSQPVLQHDDERSHMSDDNSAELLDSETEPCLLDPDCTEEWWSGAEGAGAWSGEELSPVRDEPPTDGESPSERDSLSLRNLSAAIAHRQRSEAEDAERGTLLDRVLAIDNRLTELLRALRLAAVAADDADSVRLAVALRDKIDMTERNVADVVVKKLAELDASKNMMEQYRQSIETLKRQLRQGEGDALDFVEEDVISCSESDRRERYEALDAALSALSCRPQAVVWPPLSALRAALERLAFALAAAPAPPNAAIATQQPLHTSA